MDLLSAGPQELWGVCGWRKGRRNKQGLSSLTARLLFSAISWAPGQSRVCKDWLLRENLSNIEMLEGETACPCA